MSTRQDVARVIKNTAMYYNRAIEAEVLSMMCDDLCDLGDDAVIEAYHKYRKNPANKFFPLPAQIRELINPDEFISIEAKAREIAARITGAIPRYGWNNGPGAEEFIGPEGWEAVRRQGGWSYLCENMGLTINPTTFQAQMRDQLEGSLRYGSPALEQSIKQLPKNSSNELTNIGDILKLSELKK